MAATNKVRVSNHSYGYLAGWQQRLTFGTNAWWWTGDDSISTNQDWHFGFYENHNGEVEVLSLNRRRAACKLILTKSQTTFMSQSIQLEVEMPDDLARFRLPEGVQHRLQELLDKQDAGPALSPEEKREAEGLVDLADLLSLLQLRAERLNGGHA